MFFRKNILSKFSSQNFRKLLLLSSIALGLVINKNAISQTSLNKKFDIQPIFSKESFVTKAVEKTGASVVTIETQKLVKQRKLPNNSRILIDPYFERFFGLQLPPENQPKIEQSQGSGFIFDDGLIMTNAHDVDGSA